MHGRECSKTDDGAFRKLAGTFALSMWGLQSP